MEALLEKAIDGLNLDRSGWQLVTFGDVAIQQKQKVDRENTDLTRYVKGEHMHSEDLHLREWGELTDEYLGPAFIRKFEAGDILYGSRRTYLRKVVIAPFDGITSNTTFVMKANEKMINERLLPFIMMSEGFTQHSIKNSKGSVNPYVNWKDLAGYEFLLPPKEDQSIFVDLLLTADDSLQKIKIQETSLQKYYSATVDNLFSVHNNVWNYQPLKIVAKINSETLSSKTDKRYEFSYLDLASIQGPKVLGEMKILQYGNAPSRARRVVNDNSTVIALVRPYQQAFVFIGMAGETIASTGTAVVNTQEGVNSRFLFHQFFSERFMRFCERMMTGTTYPAITPDDIGLYKVALPDSKEAQDEIALRLDAIETNQIKVEKVVQSLFQLQKSLINQVF